MRNLSLATLLLLVGCGGATMREAVPASAPAESDLCPAEAEDVDGHQDEDGCPDLDNDSDALLDAADACPNEPEDLDGFEDEDGCPDPDNDQDRIPDTADSCRNNPETYNGLEDEDGCPDRGCLAYGVTRVTPPVLFLAGTRTTRAERAALQAFARQMAEGVGVLRAGAEGEQGLRWTPVHTLAITAYADTPPQQALAQARVEEVRDVFLAMGITAERLVVQVLSLAQSSASDALQRVDLTVLRDDEEEYERRPDGRAERICPTTR
jgi:hypothetical protein